jgi:hypothetical protein
MALEYGSCVGPVALELEQDEAAWPFAYQRLREAVLERIELDGGQLCEGPAHRTESEFLAFFAWPAVRNQGGTEPDATEGSAQQQG